MNRGGGQEDVLGLEDFLKDTIWSPWPCPRGLQVLQKALSSAEDNIIFCFVEIGPRSWLFFIFVWEHARDFEETLRRPFFGECLNFAENLRFFWVKTFFLKKLAGCVLGPWPWPRAFSGPWPREGLSSENWSLCYWRKFFLHVYSYHVL